MALKLTRPAGAIMVGAGAAMLSQALLTTEDMNVAKALWITGLGSLIVLPIWAGWQNGGSVEVGEGAFDGLAALIGNAIGQIAVVGPATEFQVAAQASRNGHNRAALPVLLAILAPP